MKNKPAFPLSKPHKWAEDYGNGMTLRDWFAGQALSGLVTAFTTTPDSKVASWSYDFADAMLTERNKDNEE